VTYFTIQYPHEETNGHSHQPKEAKDLLIKLAERLGISQTAVLELAIWCLAEAQKSCERFA
jgi:hypothetical protein